MNAGRNRLYFWFSISYNSGMTKVVEAIYSDGVLEPLESLGLAEKQRVRVTIEPIDGTSEEQRQAALQRLFDHIDRSSFRIQGRLPTRDELYDRF